MMSYLNTAVQAIRDAVTASEEKTSGTDGAPSDSIKHVARAGWLIIIMFFGVIG
jgi:hypothetical protein